MPQTDRVAVVATHLAADRRALSEAWYSALHLAAPPHAARPAPALPVQRTALPAAAVSAAPEPAVRGDVGAPAGDRSRPHSALGAPRRGREHARIEDALTRMIARHATGTRRRPLAATSAVVRLAGGRVQLLVRERGGRVEVVALCAPSLRERVERALAGARVALVPHTPAEAA